jgi:xanthine/CO dehydrogenase XdhC/CoxF family maturation factor
MTSPMARRDVRLDTSLELLLDHARDNPSPKVLATLVATTGSTYRKPGARMLIMEDGTYVGLISGGCLESDLKIHAERVLNTQHARAVEYDMRGPDDVLFGIGAGCEGAMRILLEPAGPDSLAVASLRAAESLLIGGGPASLIVVHDSSDIPLGTYHTDSSLPAGIIEAAAEAASSGVSRAHRYADGARATTSFLQHVGPRPHLLVCGAGPDAVPVAAGAIALGWKVTVVDHRPAYAVADHFPGATVVRADAHNLGSAVDVERCHAAVVMSHHLASDTSYLREIAKLRSPGYVGLLGPRSRREHIANELGEAMQALNPRLHSPVGLSIGAVTPEGIALAIVSQIHGWLAGREVTA